MAFVNVNIALGRPSLATRRSTCVRTPVMSADFSRRQMLRAAGVAFGLTVVADVARAFDLKELKEDVEEIKYDEEVQEIGPDSKEELILRQKKEQKEDPVSTFVVYSSEYCSVM